MGNRADLNREDIKKNTPTTLTSVKLPHVVDRPDDCRLIKDFKRGNIKITSSKILFGFNTESGKI